MNTDEYRERNRIASYVRQGKDLGDTEGEEFERIDDNEDIPKILLDRQRKFSYLLNRDGLHVGFLDYP
jgi:beta-1,4-mannosyl-glycoprotein beta-1,4-N-acetylglucosaminyltransferase